MDTRLCDGVYRIADGADLLVVESTFLQRDARLAEDYGHLTAAQAARVARECGVRRLVLTHFSQRYRIRSCSGGRRRTCSAGSSSWPPTWCGFRYRAEPDPR